MKFEHFLVLRTLCHMKSKPTRALTLAQNIYLAVLSAFQCCSQKCGHYCATLWRNHQFPHFLPDLDSLLQSLSTLCISGFSFFALTLNPIYCPHVLLSSKLSFRPFPPHFFSLHAALFFFSLLWRISLSSPTLWESIS